MEKQESAMKRVLAGNASGEHFKKQADEFAESLRPVIGRMTQEGHTSFWALARALNLEGVAPRRSAEWHPSSVMNLVRRLSVLSAPHHTPDEQSNGQHIDSAVALDYPARATANWNENVRSPQKKGSRTTQDLGTVGRESPPKISSDTYPL